MQQLKKMNASPFIQGNIQTFFYVHTKVVYTSLFNKLVIHKRSQKKLYSFNITRRARW